MARGPAPQPATARRAATQVRWDQLEDDVHGELPISWAWPWDPPDGPQVAGRFLSRGEAVGTQAVVLEPAQIDPETGLETEPAVVEYVDLWVNRVHVDEWGDGADGDTTLQLRSDAPVTLL